MSYHRPVSIALGLLACLLSGATAAEQNHLTVGVGLDLILSVEGGLSDADSKQRVDIKVTGDKIAYASVATRRRLQVQGRRRGKVTMSFTTLDGKLHRYHVEVVKPTKKMLEPDGMELIDLGVGQVRILETPVDWRKIKKGGPYPLIATSNPWVVDYEIASFKNLILAGRKAGYSNLTFVSPSDEVTRFLIRVTKSRSSDPADQKPEKLALIVGKPLTLKLPQTFHEDGARGALARPELVKIEENMVRSESASVVLEKVKTFTLVPKQAGTTDLLLFSLRNQPKGTERPIVHYQITIEDPKRDGKK